MNKGIRTHVHTYAVPGKTEERAHLTQLPNLKIPYVSIREQECYWSALAREDRRFLLCASHLSSPAVM